MFSGIVWCIDCLCHSDKIIDGDSVSLFGEQLGKGSCGMSFIGHNIRVVPAVVCDAYV